MKKALLQHSCFIHGGQEAKEQHRGARGQVPDTHPKDTPVTDTDTLSSVCQQSPRGL